MKQTLHKELARLFSIGKEKKFSDGELIVIGEEESGVFFIKEGFVKVYSISDDGNKYLHIIYKKGEVFPLIWALKGIKRRVFYEAISNATVLEIPKTDFLDTVKNSARHAYEVLTQLIEQFNTYADRLDNLQYKKTREKVVYRLLFLAGRFGIKDGKKITINAPITHELLAESINLARETVSREIEKLEKSGLITKDKGLIVITDANKLSKQFSEPISLDLWGLQN